MPEFNYTKDGLPVVSEETIKAMSNLDSDFYLDINDIKDLRIILREKPNLGLFLEDIKDHVRSHYGISADFILLGLAAGAKIVYGSLRKQAAANKLERELGQK